MDSRRRYERIEIELPCRLYIPEGKKGEELKFQSFNTSANLGLGGVFVTSTFLLKPGIELWVEISLPDEALPIRGRIAHAIGLDDPKFPSGMGIEFLDVDSHGRETLLRYFTPARYQEFYSSMLKEFPHLERSFALQDASLILNLWEEWKVRREGGPMLTDSGAPEPPAKRRR
ncbi:MAG: PilZ domain-containing protein [Deltaproteobacteria bacterium]|nr:PilZ domain-containing protein [Deltaproteobacteria bacterium]